MILFFSAQDLQTCWIGLIEKDSFQTLESSAVPPEQYLRTVNQFLSQQNLLPEQLSGIYVVTGPGSFTSSRISLTIANTLHFVHQIPLFVLQNPENLHPAYLLKRAEGILPLADQEYAHAFYNRPPHIT